MSIKKFNQLMILAAMVLSSLFITSGAMAASACGDSYIVAKGDTLRKIAELCGTTVSALQRANPEIANANIIYPNQHIVMPGAMLKDSNGRDVYVVARGDTLKALATRFNTSMDALLKLNPSITNANLIYEGQRMIVSGTIPTTPPPATGGQTYVVQKGDTLGKIANRLNITVDALLKVNPKITNANKIYVGQKITIPVGVASYIVQKGDTLAKIASSYNTTVKNLLALNPDISNADKIYVGQIIRLK